MGTLIRALRGLPIPTWLLTMKYRDLNIQTQREAPNNARTEGFSFLVRAGYLTRENLPTQLGEYALGHLRQLASDPSFLFHPFESLRATLSLSTIGNDHEGFGGNLGHGVLLRCACP